MMRYLGLAPRYDWQEVALGYTIVREQVAADIFNGYELATPHIWLPKPIELVATAAALAIVRNLVVTRRFWQGWAR